jgi:hypothetical protein
MHLIIEYLNLLQVFSLIKIITDFYLTDEYKLFQSVVDQFAIINFSIDLKSFRIIFESIYFYKKVFWGGLEAEVIIMFKILVLQ